MNSVLVENMPSKIINKFWNKIDYNILCTYIQSEKKEEKDIEDMSLLEYINSDAYKDEPNNYQTPKEFLSDLKNMRN